MGWPPIARRGVAVAHEDDLAVVRLGVPDPDRAGRVAEVAGRDRLGHRLGGVLDSGILGGRVRFELAKCLGVEALGGDESARQRVTCLASRVTTGGARMHTPQTNV